jgi:hypothetical protein
MNEPPITHHLRLDCSNADNAILALLASPLATFLAGWDKFGTRLTIFTGMIFEV